MPQEQGIAQRKALPDFLILKKWQCISTNLMPSVLEGIQFPLRHIFTSHFAW
jgi:hypothetical protein